MQGARELHRRRVLVRTGEAMTKPPGLETYTRATLHVTDDGGLPRALSSGDQGSSMLHSLTRADCLLVFPADGEFIAEGTVVDAIPLR
jgi:molybdopterin molybdotransferase